MNTQPQNIKLRRPHTDSPGGAMAAMPVETENGRQITADFSLGINLTGEGECRHRNPMKIRSLVATLLLLAVCGLFSLVGNVGAQTITYQGVLNDGGEPANGVFEIKFQFRQPGPPPILFDPPIEIPVNAIGGRFTALLDTRGIPIEDPSPLELVICVRRPGEVNYVQLDPPQPVTPTPRAIVAEFATNVPVTALPPTVVRNDVPAVFSVPGTFPELQLSGPTGIVRFGGGECTIGIDPLRPGLTESDPFGFRLLGQRGEGCRLLFGGTDDCTIEVGPPGGLLPPGLLLRDPTCIRVLPPLPGQDPSVIYFGATDDCSLGIDPTGPGGLVLRDPRGVRVLDPSGRFGPTLRFGPTDECTIGLDPELPGLVERDPTGFRLLGQDNQGCRLIFGPTLDCTVEVDPKGPSGLLLRDPNGIRILNPNAAGNPSLRFGPTDECILLADPERGLLLRDPRGITLPFPTDPTGKLLPSILTMGNAGECRWRVNAPDTGPKGMILDDPNGLLLVNPEGGAGALNFGETGECRIRIGALPNRQSGMIFEDPGGMQFNTPESFFDVIIATEFVQTSTRRLKENIQPIVEPLEKIQQLKGVTFDWKPEHGGKASLGFIAEDVGKVFPEVVSYEKDGVNARGVNYGHLVAVTVEGIKAQQDQIEGLSKENKELKQSLDDMKARMERLAEQVESLTTR